MDQGSINCPFSHREPARGLGVAERIHHYKQRNFGMFSSIFLKQKKQKKPNAIDYLSFALPLPVRFTNVKTIV